MSRRKPTVSGIEVIDVGVAERATSNCIAADTNAGRSHVH